MVVFLTINAACGSSEQGPTGAAGSAGARDSGPCEASSDVARPDHGDCQPVVASHPLEGGQHLPLCAPLTYGTNPPSSGNHYPLWAAYRSYDRAIPRGFWVHSLEHGAVVITYNCPGGCPDEVADVQAFVDGLPTDCGTERRVILTPDPDLDVRFAASAWGWTLRANCFDRGAFSAFFTDHYNHAPEAICGGGTDPTDMCGPSSCP
jgi:hypothetical protein